MDVTLQKILGGLPTPSAKKTASAEAGAGPPTLSRASEGDSSPDASLRIAGITERLLAEPAVDSSRVGRVSGEIQSGTYQVNAQRAADKMIELELFFR